MNSQPPPAPDEVRSAGQYLRPLRDTAANVLVAATAVMLFVAIIRLIPSGSGPDFGTRAQEGFYTFVSVPTIVFPLAAVLLSLLVKPQHRQARLITQVALVEYGVAAFFGLIFGFLIGLIKIGSDSGRMAFEELLLRVTWLTVFAVAAYATYQIWRNLFYTPKPKPEPGVYGQPKQPAPEHAVAETQLMTPGSAPTHPGPAHAAPETEAPATYDPFNEPTMVVPQQDPAGEDPPRR